MRIYLAILVSVVIALAALGCKEDVRLRVLFTGDEHDLITPVG